MFGGMYINEEETSRSVFKANYIYQNASLKLKLIHTEYSWVSENDVHKNDVRVNNRN